MKKLLKPVSEFKHGHRIESQQTKLKCIPIYNQ